MAQIKEFVINDRRKFTAEGDPRPDAPPSEPRAPQATPSPEPVEIPRQSQSAPLSEAETAEPEADLPANEAQQEPEGLSSQIPDDQLPPPPTAEQSQQAARAYEATVDRLETAIRATNPGMERMPKMTFDRVIQSLYMQALLQLGAAAEPGQQPQVDILGARQTIDMLTSIETKTRGNLSEEEQKLIDSALFEIRMAFLEITQALARQAQSRQPAGPGGGKPGVGIPGMPAGGPSIVR